MLNQLGVKVARDDFMFIEPVFRTPQIKAFPVTTTNLIWVVLAEEHEIVNIAESFFVVK